MPRVSKLRTVEELNSQNRSYVKPRDFHAWDGEGVTTPANVHNYIMLMSSKDGALIDRSGISTYDNLTFLCDAKKRYPQDIHVGYGLSYDANMMFKDIPYERLKLLQQGKRIGFNNFSIEYRQRKCLTIARYLPNTKHYIKNEKGEWKSTHTERITLWDVVGFFQSSFVNALIDFFPSLDEQRNLHLEEIIEGKKDRGTFKKEQLNDFIIPYTQYEVDALVALMNRFRDYCKEAGIVLNRYDGAGAIAAYLLEKHKVKQYFGVRVVETKKRYNYGEIPPQVMTASQHSYSGGRIEGCQYGHFEQLARWIFHYDLISAYPAIMPLLPELSTGRWLFHKSNKIHFNNPFTMYKVYWDFPAGQAFYPFSYRDVGNVIRFPRRGYNWMWYPELIAAQKMLHVTNGILDIREQWEYIPGSDKKPYDFVPELFLKRQEWKKQGIGAQKPLKLGINAFYGKTAQRLGYDHESGRLPPFFQLQYAGYITSAVRAQLYLAGMQKPSSIIAFATDGLWSTEELHLDTSGKLGSWECEKLSSMTAVQAGVYFAHKPNDKVKYDVYGETIKCPIHGEKCEETHHYRGFNKEGMNEEDILQAWKDGKTELGIKTKRFVTLGTGITTKHRYEHVWRTWPEEPRMLRLKPRISEKRYDDIIWTENRNPAYGLIPTKVTEAENFVQARYPRLKDEHLSIKHILPWEQDEKDDNIEFNMALAAEIQEIDA